MLVLSISVYIRQIKRHPATGGHRKPQPHSRRPSRSLQLPPLGLWFGRMEDLQSALLGHGLTVASLPGKGRGLIATRDFSPGDVLFFQEPYAFTPNTFFVGRSCDGCFVSENLKKCSACRIAWYCGSTCQKSEWKLHQLECQALATLGENRRKMLTPSIRLMMRLLLKRKLQSEQVIPRSSTDNYDLVEALVSHMSDIDEKQLILYAQMANLVKLVLPSLEISIQEVAEVFSKLSCNAHTICDSELQPLGTGLYPVISTINHSCLPNSVLVFEGRVAMVRAMENIAKGTEVSISYIETAATTMKRLKSLKEQYFFTCMCLRCIKHNQYEDLQEAAIMEGYRCKDKKCSGFLLHDSEKKQFTCQKCGLSRDQQDLEKGVDEVEQLSEKAAKCLVSCNYFEASALYKSIEQLQIKLFHSLSIHLMRTRENLLKIMMELKDWTAALTYCSLTVPAYQRIYPATHPMLGLQYYSCGKLEWLLGYTDAALKSFTRAVDILQITHGTSTPFMRELLNKMDEARAEAAHRLAGSSN